MLACSWWYRQQWLFFEWILHLSGIISTYNGSPPFPYCEITTIAVLNVVAFTFVRKSGVGWLMMILCSCCYHLYIVEKYAILKQDWHTLNPNFLSPSSTWCWTTLLGPETHYLLLHPDGSQRCNLFSLIFCVHQNQLHNSLYPWCLVLTWSNITCKEKF